MSEKIAPFTGELAIPIELESLHELKPQPIPSDPDQANAIKNWWDEYQRREQLIIAIERKKKMPLVFQHYGINQAQPDAWEALACKLAYDLIPGFKAQRPNKLGPKVKWNKINTALLWFEVQKYILEKNVKARRACRFLVTKSPWKELLSRPKISSQNTDKLIILYKVYNEQSCHSDFVDMFNKMIAEEPELHDSILNKFIDGLKKVLDELAIY